MTAHETSVRPAIGGFVAPGMEPVAAEFVRNFAERDELGAAFAVVRGNAMLVDLWGGVADRGSGRPWTRETMQIIFSGSKGLVATSLLMLIDRGALSLDAPVARYWPEFAASGKGHVKVRDVMTHSAGLPAISVPISLEDAADDARMAALLAQQSLSTDPRATRTYHALTFGWLCGELVRRVDGRSIGEFIADEISGPLGLELWIGLPERFEGRLCTIELAEGWGTKPDGAAAKNADDPLWQGVFGNPLRYDPDHFPWNDPAWHHSEIPAANAIGTARSIATFYAQLGDLLSDATLATAIRPQSTRHDPLLDREVAFGLGLQLQTAARALGPPSSAFGHGGSGGSTHGCWPSHGVGFSYAMNHLRDDPVDARATALLSALHACLAQ